MSTALRFRQVHLDFHTSPEIPGVGAKFKKREFQEALKAGRVDSITVFSKCHHGLSYHPTKVGTMHPTLKRDLLREQVEACREIDVNAPIYLSAGVDNVVSQTHPEWRNITPEGKYLGWVASPLEPGFHRMCFNTPYLDYLCAQIREVVELYPDCNGIFLDIVGEADCCCAWCMAWMAERGLDARDPANRKKASAYTLEKYYRETFAAARSTNPEMPVFHNSGHIAPGHHAYLKYFSHLELESLPTGGWGYDHYPLTARYAQTLGMDFLGMTGKFHRSWGEFGGFKHPNALRYECAAMLSLGSKCSVGDQLHPSGKMDASTYEIIGAAYDEIAEKEAWCSRVDNISDIGLIMSAATHNRFHLNNYDDQGASRVLLEGHFLFDALDTQADFAPYKMLILPDIATVDAPLKKKLDAYLKKGGKLLLAGGAGVAEATESPCDTVRVTESCGNEKFLFDIGAEFLGKSEFDPDYALPRKDLRPSFVTTPIVMYGGSRRIRVTDGTSLGDVYDPYFNRDYRHFCSHRHTPNKATASGYACGVLNKSGNILYLAHNVFELYRAQGAVAYREYIVNAIKLLLGAPTLSVTGLPSTGRVTLTEQKAEKRLIVHALYANTVLRGDGVEVVEELTPVHDIVFTLRTTRKIKSAKLVPENVAIDFSQNGDTVTFALDRLCCHQMIELAY